MTPHPAVAMPSAHRQRAMVLLAVCLAIGPLSALAQDAQLAPAPLRFEAQDAGAWADKSTPKSTKSRDEVVALYRTTYQPGDTVPLGWTGSVAQCDPGTSTLEHQQAVIARVSYFRALVGLPPVALLAGSEPAQEQAAALMMSANNALSHTPPSSWICYSASGATGAGTSDIALGAQGVDAVDLFMDDPGTGNAAAGHRRWILFPPRNGMATGDVAGGNSPPRPANALYVLGPSGSRPATPSGVAWPPAGFVPYENLPAGSDRWSFSFPGASFSNVKVTMTGPAGPIAVTLETIVNGYGDNTIVFLPDGVDYGKPAADTEYTVTVSGMTGPNVPASITYTVTVIDPEASAPAGSTIVDVIEYYNPVLDHYFITWLPSEIASLDAGSTPTPWLRTGFGFKAYASAQPGSSPVCRFYIPPAKGDSHFFGRGTAECDATGANHPDFVLEDAHFMYMSLPSAGTCPADTVPIYRVFSNRADANHRYMTDPSVRDQMVASGWLAEGDGPNLVVMCAPM